MSRVVFVTGATGFLGPWIVGELRARGARVHALARASSPRAALGSGPVTWHVGDVTSPQSVEAALDAAAEDARRRSWPLDVIHGAAVISYRRSDSERMRSTNVEGTWNVLAACRRAHVRRVLHVSSVVALGLAPGATSASASDDEDLPFDDGGLGVAYVTTKRAAEEVALGLTGELDVRSVNPAAIFGPAFVRGAAATSNTARFLERVAAGRLGPFVPPGGLSVVDVRDVAAGCLAALDRGPAGRRFALAAETYSFGALFEIVAAAVGTTRIPRLRLGIRAWSLACGAAGLVERRRPEGEVTRAAVAMLGRRFVARSDRARRELLWRARPFAETLADTLAAATPGAGG